MMRLRSYFSSVYNTYLVPSDNYIDTRRHPARNRTYTCQLFRTQDNRRRSSTNSGGSVQPQSSTASSEVNSSNENISEKDAADIQIRTITPIFNRLSCDMMNDGCLWKQQRIEEFLDLPTNIKRLDSATSDLHYLHKRNLLVLFCSQDREIGRLFIDYLQQAFTTVNVIDVSCSMYGSKVFDFWQNILKITSYVIVLMSRDFLRFVSRNPGVKIFLHHMDKSRRTMIAPVYLENVLFDYSSWWFDFGNRQGISFDRNVETQMNFLHRNLKSIFEEEVKQRYKQFEFIWNDQTNYNCKYVIKGQLQRSDKFHLKVTY